MAEEYSKYKLYRKYKTEDGVTYTPLDEYQALYESGDGVDCSCGYRETEWIGSGIYECGSIKEYEITEKQMVWFDSANIETTINGESVTVVEIELPKGFYDKDVKLFYNYGSCCDGRTNTITIVSSGTYLPNDTLYVLKYDDDDEGALKGYCYGLEGFSLYIDGVESGTTYDKTFKMKLYNGRMSEVLNEKIYCPTDSSYDEITDNTKMGDIVGLSYDCGYGGYKLDFDNSTEAICSDEYYPKLEITRVEGDWTYEYDSDNGIYTITSSLIELSGETTARVYFKLDAPSIVNISSTSNGENKFYGTKISDIDSDISSTSSGTTFNKTFTISDTDEHFFEAQYVKQSLCGDYNNTMEITLKLSTSYDYNQNLQKYDIVKYDLTDSSNNEVLNYFYPLKKVVKLSEIDNDTVFKTIYFDYNEIKKMEGFSYSFSGSSSTLTFGWNTNTSSIKLCEGYCYTPTDMIGCDIKTYTTKYDGWIKGDNDYGDLLNVIYVEGDEAKCYDSIEYIPSDDDEIIDGEDLFYYKSDISPLHTYRKVQGYKICNGENVGKHIGDYEYQIYEENKYYNDFTMTVTGSGKATYMDIAPNYYLNGSYYSGGYYTTGSSELDAVTTINMFRLCDGIDFSSWYPLVSINSMFGVNFPSHYGDTENSIKGVRLPSFKHLIESRNAFWNCIYLETVDATYTNVIPEQITYYDDMFYGCSRLTSLILGDVTQEQYDWWYARLTDAGIQDNVTITYNIV